MLNIPDKPFVATLEEWEDWHTEAKKKYPIRYFLTHTLPCRTRRGWYRFVHEPWYWLKCRLFHRYNVIVCRKLGPTWVDRDHLMFHAAFQCLVDYVEKEDPEAATQTWNDVYKLYRTPNGDGNNHNQAKKRADDYMVIKKLYHWYKKLDPYDNDHQKQNEMLHRLIDIRGYLWT